MHQAGVMEYPEESWLALSGLQHFAFCRRQWALIEIEQLWRDNERTVDGTLLHEHAHDAFFTEKRGKLLISRAMPVFSRTLGVTGKCDVVELTASADGVPIFGRDGTYLPMPVEYKRGAPKETDADRLQLCCEAMCLEEMLACEIAKAAIYYGETNRREWVTLDAELREQVREMLAEMHELSRRRHTPKAKPTKSCNACSLKNLCLPKLSRKCHAADYIRSTLREETP